VGQLCYVIRKRIKLEPQQAIFVFVGGKLPPTARLLRCCRERERYKLRSVF